MDCGQTVGAGASGVFLLRLLLRFVSCALAQSLKLALSSAIVLLASTNLVCRVLMIKYKGTVPEGFMQG